MIFEPIKMYLRGLAFSLSNMHPQIFMNYEILNITA